MPEPHVFEHKLHSDQSNTQSTSQGPLSHVSDCGAGQIAPAPVSCVATEAVRLRVPEPHVFEHKLQSDQSNTQSTSQGPLSHVSDCGAGQIAPAPVSCVATEAVRLRVPEPHVFEHKLHSDQSNTQSTSQGPLSHVSDCGAGQIAPAPVGCVVTEAVRLRVPEPHVFEHKLHSDQSNTQSTSQGPLSHDSDCGAGQIAPAPVSCVATEAVRLRVPEPHVFEHKLQSDQSNTQSTSQGPLSHVSDCGAGQIAPAPVSCVVTEAVRLRVPEPHVFEHKLHSDQSNTQSTSQGPLSHVSDCGAGQIAPAPVGCVVTEAVRLRVPEPHVFEHKLHSDQSNTQSTSQGPLSHVSDCGAGQIAPDPVSCVATEAVRLRVPEPHVFEHKLHSDQSNTQSTSQGPLSHVSDCGAGQIAPAPVSCVATEAVRLRVPEPHVFEHKLHSDQSNTQSTSQGPLSHVSDCGAGQIAPAPVSCVATEAVRLRVPEPHVFEHKLHSDQSNTQSTSQGPLSPVSDCGAGQIAPAPVGCVVTEAVRLRVPEPHVFEHKLHSDQSNTQSISSGGGAQGQGGHFMSTTWR